MSNISLPCGDAVLFILISFFIGCSCDVDPTTFPTATAPPHRGAARQMYGSGSLRPAGAKPLFPFGQRHGGLRTTVSPDSRRRRPHQSYPRVPFLLPIDTGGYPIFVNPFFGNKPQNKDDGKPSLRGVKVGQFGKTKTYPLEFDGILIGRGVAPIYAGPRSSYPMPRGRVGNNGRVNMRFPDDAEGGGRALDDKREHPCGEDCKENEFLCIKSCVCINSEFRCDADHDCEGGEDELECGEITSTRKCSEDTNHRCPRSGRCISKDFLCDGDDDCGDYSDEAYCPFGVNCTSEQFECGNGLCIPKNWVCDNDNDCKDFSDEVNCTKNGCTEDEHECNDGTCISLSWKCDRQVDCLDGSDESDCDITPPFCNEDEFHCASQKCVKLVFKCDGDDDCGDWSDENDCPKRPGNCGSGEFKCNSGKCVPERYRCDKQQDCEDNEDEANCDYTVLRSCSTDEFTCDNGACILKTWVCDGYKDCIHGEDEATCEIVCDAAKFPCSGPDITDNTTSLCINKKHVCDGQRDCPKGEDELNCPTKRECEQGTKCSQVCITTATNKSACTCLPGFTLAKNGYDCEDINECLYATDPVCSQTCNNTVGSFKCGCMTGYVMRPDHRSCKALGAPPTLLFANRIDIRQVSLSNTKYTAIVRGLHNAIALDYHYDKSLLFWSDVSMDVIRRSYINGTGVTDIIKWGLESPGGVALDWIHDLIFWTDSGTRRIEVGTLDGKQRVILIANDLDKPRAIAVHPGEALIFWTDWGPNPKIEKAEMDGSNRAAIITETIFWPNGLTVDYTTNKLFWADAKHNVIETAAFDGNDRRKIISKGLPHPFAITIFEDAIYWTDWHTKSISTANKVTGAGLRTLHSQLHFPMDIHSYHPQRQPDYRNHCGKNNGNCEDLCVPNKNSYTCFCRMGQRLKADRRSCAKPDKFLFFARKKDLRIQYLDETASNQHDIVIPVDGIKSAVAIAWDSSTDMIFWTDVEKDTISKSYWNGSNQQVVVHSNLGSPAGLALDWVTKKIYWTDSGTSRIETANLDGSLRTLLIWEGLDKPRDIVVDPLSGYMYWSDWGENPQIERAAMDGSMRSVILSNNLTWPNGLAIDHGAGKLYWVDAGTKAIETSNLDGSNRQILLVGNEKDHPFGLDIYGNYIYWTDWQTKGIERINKSNGLNRTVLCSNVSDLMDVRVFHRNRKAVKTPCNNNNGGCTHLCLLRPKGHTCACPTGIKLGDDGKTCANGPKNFLILAHRVDIRQISLDVPYFADVVLPFPQLKMANSVDVDRKTGEIYWTDTAESSIQKNTPDGKNIKLLITREIQTPNGIAIDSTGRKMYWTDGDRNTVEVAELDGSNRKILIGSNLDNPRAIALHYHHGLIFWSDWGNRAKIEVAYMDGTNRKSLITDNIRAPNGLAIDRPAGRLYWNDAKLNTIEYSDLSGKGRKVILRDVARPYGLVVVGNHMYWTEWQTQALHRAEKTSGSDKTIIREHLEGLMDVRSVQSDNIALNACGNDNGGCSNLCLRNPSSFTCICPTGIKKINKKTCNYQPSSYLLIAARFHLSRISMDTTDYWDVTLIPDYFRNIIDTDFHWKKQLIYTTDIQKNAIESVNMKNLSDIKTIVGRNLSQPDGIAVDWIANNIYWSNTGNKIIEVAKLDGSSRKTVVNGALDDPRSVAVFPRKGFLFWTDWGIPKIERSFLDGSERKVLIEDKITFPIGLTIDYELRRIYWIDAKLNEERIESCDLRGKRRNQLHVFQSTHPFSLTIYGNYIYWTDWVQKVVFRANKQTGQDSVVVGPNLVAAMGIMAVSEKRQDQYWNPCAVNNGGCTHFCFFRLKNYTCGCPDENTENCSLKPKTSELTPCSGEIFKCDEEDDDYVDDGNDTFKDQPQHHDSTHSYTFFIVTLVPITIILCLFLALVAFIFKKHRKKYLYGKSRSFSNPNYYSNNADPNAPPPPTERKQFIWKRLKYDKSQDRVYEEPIGTNSPEVASLIPAILTPSSSNCEPITPELERSPSVTPLHQQATVKVIA